MLALSLLVAVASTIETLRNMGAGRETLRRLDPLCADVSKFVEVITQRSSGRLDGSTPAERGHEAMVLARGILDRVDAIYREMAIEADRPVTPAAPVFARDSTMH
jgi:hypothetical protein